MNKSTIKFGVILMIISIALGAFFKHSISEILTLNQIQSFETGIRYQMIHALALIIIGFNSNKIKGEKIISSLFIVGITFFSFSIYLLSCKQFLSFEISFLWPITPLGGLILIVSWIFLFFSIHNSKV
jgi:uncharacterized membrane protein YgdD (TMEM256/DUF423 family)